MRYFVRIMLDSGDCIRIEHTSEESARQDKLGVMTALSTGDDGALMLPTNRPTVWIKGEGRFPVCGPLVLSSRHIVAAFVEGPE